MSMISDVRELYGTLQTTWSKTRVHVITHAFFFALVFWIGGATLANSSLPHISAKDIADNDWFKLAKDTGLIYAILALPIVAVSVYLTIFDVLGQSFSTAFAVFFLAPERTRVATALSASELEPIAMSLPNDDFDLAQVLAQLNGLTLKLREEAPKEWSSYEEMVSRISGNSMQYLGDFCTFFVVWMTLSIMRRSGSWIELNGLNFWSIGLVLLALIWFASMRVSRALTALPILQMKFTSAMIGAHPNLVSTGAITDEERDQRLQRLDNLVRAARDAEDLDKSSRPSFRRVFGLVKEPARSRYAEFSDTDKVSFYERGRRLRHGSPRNLSVTDVLAYKFSIACDRLKRAYSQFVLLVRYAITGVPPI
jgi:hypothetical protein